MDAGKLYLLPTLLSGENFRAIPEQTLEVTRSLRLFFAENERTARRYLRLIGYPLPLDTVKLLPFHEHVPDSEIAAYLQLLASGTDGGILSEAGLPVIADPGSALVRLAHTYNIRVVPLSGPSSVFLALMASGLNGQQFLFSGYPPVKSEQRLHFLRHADAEARRGITQILIETPYRNETLLHAILSTCRSDTLLCIASDLTGQAEKIRTHPVGTWKKMHVQLGKVPAIFLLGT